MFENEEANNKSLKTDFFNYDQDKHSLINDNKFLPDDLDGLDSTFVTEVCESLDDHEWLVCLSSEYYMITPLGRSLRRPENQELASSQFFSQKMSPYGAQKLF